MSWDSYIQNLMAPDVNGVHSVKSAAICGKQGYSVWASSGINITSDEIKVLCGDSKGFAQCGPTIGGIKCRMLRDNKDTEGMYCIDFKTTADSEGNTFSVCVGFTLTAIIIVVGTKDASGGQISSKMYEINSYLRKSNM